MRIYTAVLFASLALAEVEKRQVSGGLASASASASASTSSLSTEATSSSTVTSISQSSSTPIPSQSSTLSSITQPTASQASTTDAPEPSDSSEAPTSTYVPPPPAPPAHTGLTGPGVAYNFTGMNLTYYYDNTMPPHKACAAVSGGNDWSIPINKNPSACGPSIFDMHTDNIVALNVSWLNQDGMTRRPDLCGREIQIWSKGRKLNTGTLFLWEGCAACESMPRADVSVGTYIKATGDKDCTRGTMGGFDVLVLEHKVHTSSVGRLRPAVGIALVLGLLVVLV